MSARLLLTVLSALFVGLVWQGESLAQDKKDSGGKVTSSSKKVTSSTKKSAAPTVKKKVTSGAGSKATAAPASKKKVISGGGSKTTSAPAVNSRVSSGGGSSGPATSKGLGGNVAIKKPLPDSTTTLKVEPTENKRSAPPPDGGGTSTTQSSGSAGLPAVTLDENAGADTGQPINPINNDMVVDDADLLIIRDADADGEEYGNFLAGLGEGTPYRQVGDDVYWDEDGDGDADGVYRNAHINDDGDIIAGPPPTGGNGVGANGGVVVENVYVTVVDQAGAPNGSVVGSVPPEGNYRQVGNDLYVDEDGDGRADVVYRNTHVDYRGDVVAGQPEVCTIDAVPGADDDFANDFSLRQDPDEQGDGINPDEQGDGTKRPPVTARVNLFGGDRTPAQPAPAALPTGDVAQTLGELKSLYDKGLLPDSQYEIMQGQALAALDPQATGIEGGLQTLRDFWDQGLISADPYAVKRKEYLDAL